MPPTSFHHRAATPAPPEAVWDRLQDPDVWAGVAGADRTSDHVHAGAALTSFRFTASIGGVSYGGHARVTEARPNRSMTLTVDTNEVKGSIEVAVSPDGSGTSLDVRMSIRPAGLMGTVVFPVVASAVSNSFAESVDRLAASLG